jgi:hypothetical protein
MTTQDSRARTVVARCCAPVLRPTRDSVRVLALAFVTCLRYQPGSRRRRDLVLLSAALPGGVIAQAGPATTARNPQAPEVTLGARERMTH